MNSKYLKIKRYNPATGEYDYYFPQEITDPATREYAKVNGLEIGMAQLGYRKFEAVFVPCKDCVHDKGKEIYLDTPSEIQHKRFCAFIREELKQQDKAKQDGRCQIPDGKGGVKRCPTRVPNPNYDPSKGKTKDNPKTVPVRCEGCENEPFRQAHTSVALSCLDHMSDDGTLKSYEIPAPSTCYAGDDYLRLREDCLSFVSKRGPQLLPFAELRTLEYTKSEAAKELDEVDSKGKVSSTIGTCSKELGKLVIEFLSNAVPFQRF